jgi:hypothetical protein
MHKASTAIYYLVNVEEFTRTIEAKKGSNTYGCCMRGGIWMHVYLCVSRVWRRAHVRLNMTSVLTDQ